MIFGFFSRKSESVVQADPSTTTAIASSDQLQQFQFPPKQQHTPAPSIDDHSFLPKGLSRTGSNSLPPTGPIDTPSPDPANADKGEEADDLPTDPTALHNLIASVPAKTLHAYIIAHLSPVPPSPFPFAVPSAGLILQSPPRPPSPRTLDALTDFFSCLSPPPKLHCVRCHKGYFELENTDWSCRVPHDDESAIVDRVRTGLGSEFETLWGCCGRTVDGDGDQGPPDGWCYEGKHTTDVKRARFRADSTPHEDKLNSCSQLRCGESPRAPRVSSRLSKKRTRVDDDDDGAEGSPSVTSSIHSRSKSTGHRKTVSISSTTKGEDVGESEKARPAKKHRTRKSSSVSVLASKNHEESGVNREFAMDVDIKDKETDREAIPLASKVHPSPPKSPRRIPAATKPRSKPKPVSSSPKPRSKGWTVQKSPLSASFTAAGSATDTGEVANTTPPPAPSRSIDQPSTPMKKNARAQIVEVEILTRSPSAASVNGLKKNASAGRLNASPEMKKGRKAKAQNVSRKQKKIGEVVETSVDGEADWT